MTKTNDKKHTLLKEIERFEKKLQRIFYLGMDGMANYPERIDEAKRLLNKAMYETEQTK